MVLTTMFVSEWLSQNREDYVFMSGNVLHRASC